MKKQHQHQCIISFISIISIMIINASIMIMIIVCPMLCIAALDRI